METGHWLHMTEKQKLCNMYCKKKCKGLTERLVEGKKQEEKGVPNSIFFLKKIFLALCTSGDCNCTVWA